MGWQKTGGDFKIVPCTMGGPTRVFPVRNTGARDSPAFFGKKNILIPNNRNSPVCFPLIILILSCLLLVPPVTGADWIISSDTSLAAGNYSYDTVTVESGATLTLMSDTSLTGYKGVNLTATNLIVASGAAITADSQGWPANSGPGVATDAYAGAGYGGTGGHSGGGATYGSATVPVDPGSGSMGSSAGGGAMILNVTGILQNEGQITANGGAVTYGGGSGGSIWVNTGTLAGTGTFAANGGNASGSGAGGGGRIAIYYAASTFTSTTTVSGGTSTVGNGEAGTVGFFNTATHGFTAGSNWTFLASDGPTFSYNDVTLIDSYVVLQNSTTLSASAITLEGSTLTTVSENSIRLTTGDLTVDSLSVITADSMGYPADSGPGVATDAYAGAGYGGTGGGASGGTGGGTTYGSATVPVDMGSGSMGASAGGGAIVLNVTGTLMNNGRITANGGSVTYGGGSGGSIRVNTGTLEGYGTFSADGGTATGSGGGGGGRIAIYYANITFTGTATAAGGTSTVNNGEAGTVGYFNTSTNDFMSGSSWRFLTTDGPAFSYRNVDLTDSVVVMQNGTTLTATDITLTDTTLTTVQGHTISITAVNLTVDSISVITADSMGYPAGSGPGVATDAYAGAGYGGTGGGASGGTGGGTTYGSATVPVDMGSGSMGASAGGGAIVLNVTGTILNEGQITANGGSVTYGGGSGGSIWVNTDTLEGYGTFSADGGAATGSGGGGGGRIAIYYANTTFAGAATAAGGTSTVNDGSDGTVLWLTTPSASFTSNVTSGAAPLTVLFTDTSAGSPTSWNWSLGDGNFSTSQNVTYTYVSAGLYTVNLTATNSAGSDTTSQTITVTAAGGSPVASFTATPTSGTAPLDVTFTDISDVTSGTMWNWSFGDAAWYNATVISNPVHTYSSPGTYTVSLTVTNASGSNTTTQADYITVTSSTSFISATADQSIGPVGTVFTFSGSNTYGDSPGYYTNIFVTNATEGGTLPADGVMPDNFSVSTITGDNATFRQATVTSGSWSYAWDTAAITGGSLLPGSAYRFYFVNESLNTSSLYYGAYTRVQIGIEGPVTAGFAMNTTSGTAPFAVSFQDTSTGYPEQINLSFGDGTWYNNTGSGSWPVIHIYTVSGSFHPEIYAENSIDSDTAVNGTVTVLPASEGLPTASFTATPTSGTAPLEVIFTDTSDVTSGTSWNWSFGDSVWSNTTASSSPMHIYSSPGAYTVSLTVTNVSGTNTTTRADYITVTSTGSGDDGGDTSSGASSASAVSAAQQPAAQPPAAVVPAANNPITAAVAQQDYPLGFTGMSYNADGLGTLSINLADAKTAGATVSLYFNRVEVYQHHSPGVKTTFWGDHFTLNNGSAITGPVTRAEFVTDPLNAVLDYGQVSGAVQAVLPSLTHSGWVNNTISQNVSADILDKFAAATSANALTLQDVAYTLEVKKNGVSTGAANITFTVPAAWVNSHGGKDAVQIARISEDTGTTELIGATYLGLDSKNNMIFQGASPNGTSLFGLVTAEATAVVQKQNPNTTYVAASKPAMITNVGMFEWLLDLVVKNPALLIGIIAVVGLVAYFGWWRRRL